MRNPQTQVTEVRSLDVRQDFLGGSLPIYLGEADAATGSGESAWRIRKLTYNASNQMLLQSWATGTGGTAVTAVAGNFNQTWTSRTSYTYLEN